MKSDGGLTKIWSLRTLLCGIGLVWMAHASAVIETYTFSSPELEARYHQLSQELRCPKCQNQNIADSNSPISRDLRALTYEQLEAGASDEDILRFMVERYGEFVRYRPAVDERTALLWYGPAALVAIGVLGFAVHLRRRSATMTSTESSGLSEAERAELNRKLAVGEDVPNSSKDSM